MTNVTPINAGRTYAEHPDAFLADMARDLMCETLDLAERDGAAEPAADALAILLLAVVDLTRNMNVYGRERAIAGMLAQAVGEALDAYEEPHGLGGVAVARDAPPADRKSNADTVERLARAARAGWQLDDAAPPLNGGVA